MFFRSVCFSVGVSLLFVKRLDRHLKNVIFKKSMKIKQNICGVASLCSLFVI